MIELDDFKAYVEYLAPLAAKAAEHHTHHVVTKSEWRLISNNVADAATKLGEAVDLVTRAIPLAYASTKRQRRLQTWVESALERRFDAEDLSRRAKVLMSRAAPERDLSPSELGELEVLKEALKKAKAEARLASSVANIAKQVADALRRDLALERTHVLLQALEAAHDSVLRAAQGSVAAPDRSSEPVSPDPTNDAKRSTTVDARGEANGPVEAALLDLRQLVLTTLADLSPTADLPGRAPASPAPPGPSLLDRADDVLRRCQGTLETARGHLGDTTALDAEGTAFLNDLDLLTELVLDSRHSLSVVSHG